ncbi:hypothetical protein V1514DRAFT_327993 [Lipomyces japonicus]|uniref:uncharacterized protein n=1 Tax=Lipomyces japonicus TaxID=56871 RepID=UPI0034CFA964
MRKTLARLRPSLASLSSPLAAFDEFYVVLDEPHKVWGPGDSVTGAVVLDLPKPVKTIQLRLRLLGQLTIRNPLVTGSSFRRVLCHEQIILWDASSSSTSSMSSSSSSLPSPSRNHNDDDDAVINAVTSLDISNPNPNLTSSSSSLSSTTSLPRPTSSQFSLQSTQVVAKKLPRGEHTFAFMFELPSKGLMTSLEFEKGSIVYTLTASHHRPGPFPPATCHKLLPVQCALDIADLPPAKPSMLSVEISKKNRRRERGTATAIVETPSIGSLRGENLPVKITVRHVREVRNVTGVVITFLRISRVCAHDFEPLSFRKDLVQTVVPLYIDGKTLTTTITANMRIPADIFPTIDEYPLVAFKYCLEVVIDLSGKADLPFHRTAEDVTSRPYVDIELFKRKKGVVSLWTEIVIGTERSEHQSFKPTNSPVTAAATTTNSTTNTTTTTTTINSSNTPEPYDVSLTPSSASSASPVQAVPAEAPRYEHDANIAPAIPESLPEESEKAQLARLEAALLPSEPSPSLLPITIAGSSSQVAIESLLPSSHDQNENAGESVDKLEHERERLRALESAPTADHDDHVPEYSPSAPPLRYVDAFAENHDVFEPDHAINNRNGHDHNNNTEIDDNESDDNEGIEWVPVYSADADEEYVAMGGYHHYAVGQSDGYDTLSTENVPYENSVS